MANFKDFAAWINEVTTIGEQLAEEAAAAYDVPARAWRRTRIPGDSQYFGGISPSEDADKFYVHIEVYPQFESQVAADDTNVEDVGYYPPEIVDIVRVIDAIRELQLPGEHDDPSCSWLDDCVHLSVWCQKAYADLDLLICIELFRAPTEEHLTAEKG